MRPDDRAATADDAALPRAVTGEVVLVVEDEPGVREMTVGLLSELGYTAIAAGDVQAALDRLESADRIDVLLSDVVMPGCMEGWGLSAAARRLRPALKILLTSGYMGHYGKQVPRDLPVITKPYDRAQLAAQLQAVLQPWRHTRWSAGFESFASRYSAIALAARMAAVVISAAARASAAPTAP